ncbi:MAG: pyruvate, phosphate dikinase/phosphoenolpyruvate synthase regulator [Chlamydiota bacterium]|nr:pyruvate, phosphate dikinase/phosphoenolpyruvate synthase regulator [Chlamydiota bacterium]
MANVYTLHILSDATGDLLYHIAMAILTQFPKNAFIIKRYAFQRNEADIKKTLDSIHDGILCHGVVCEEYKKYISSECERKGIPCSDWVQPMVDFLQKTTGLSILRNPALLHKMDEKYTNMIEAVEFTIEHDDSRNLNDLALADIVLVGISRVSKTPTSVFLAMKGYKIANVSLTSVDTVPKQLQQLTKSNVVALTIQPKKLVEIRSRRIDAWGIKASDYSDLQSVIHEIMSFETYYRERAWPIVDITHLTVEETAALVINKLP